METYLCVSLKDIVLMERLSSFSLGPALEKIEDSRGEIVKYVFPVPYIETNCEQRARW